jgi:sensor histidine kinase YesM
VLNTKKFYWIAQLGGWSAYSGLLTLSVYTNSPDKLTPNFLLNVAILIVTGVLATHFQRYFFLRLNWLELRLPKLLPKLIVSSFICSIVIAFFDVVSDHYTGLREWRRDDVEISDLIVNILAVLVLVLFWNAIYFTFHFFQKSRNQEISNLELEASNKESQLKNLRSQLNPHFLFNSLNSIRALVDIDPAKAKLSVTTLSSLLRQSLLLDREDLVTLSRELILAKSYLDLEKVRFEERLEIAWEMDSDLDNFLIPPFTLQMMIENAIKHGISNLKEGGLISVKSYTLDDYVHIEVQNSGEIGSIIDTGVGIKNIKKRLELQFGNNAEFNLISKDSMVTAIMKIKV